MSTAEELYERLKKVNEPKGYYFNKNHELTMGLLEGLLTNKDRYGYMCCPCRLASGRPRSGPRHHLSVRLPRAGREGIRQLLLQPLRFEGMERGDGAERAGARAASGREDPLLAVARLGRLSLALGDRPSPIGAAGFARRAASLPPRRSRLAARAGTPAPLVLA